MDLSAAYDTVWCEGLLYKLARVMQCKTFLRLFERMLGDRQFHVTLGPTKSKVRKLRNGVPQGSVLAPLLFNIYIADMPETISAKFGYADDWAIAHQSDKIHSLNSVLGYDLDILKTYFDRWYLKMNLEKTVATMFHMSTNFHDKELEVRVGDRTLKHATNPKYLGLVLDRGLNYRKHVEAMTRKVNKRVHLLKRLAGTTWGACSTLLRQAVLALCYSPAEYCAPAFARCAYTSTLDTGLNKALRVVTGSLKSTPTQWLPVMAAIQPPHIRRETMTQKWVEASKKADVDIPLTQLAREAPNG